MCPKSARVVPLILIALGAPAAAASEQSESSCRADAQDASVRVEVRSAVGPIAAATVVLNGVSHVTDAAGVVLLTPLPGPVEIVVVKEGFAPASVSFTLRPGESRVISVDLEPQSPIEEHVTVSATRTDRPLEDQPMRVEVLDREEIEEKSMMTPGDVVMMLNEMGGLRVQATSPSLGAASVRIQGMRGRYTRFLSDGLPLFGEQVGSFGLLQIPPTDLGRVEVIKGVASSLYGAGAMGGVVNLVSRRPGDKAAGDVLLNRSTRGATDAVFWYAAPTSSHWGMTLLAGAHGQERTDVDNDGWADVPTYARGLLRPRVFWDNKAGRSLFATAGVMWETREGGTMPNAAPRAVGGPHAEALDTSRVDAGAVAQTLVADRYVVSGRASFAHQRQRHRFGEVGERDRHDNVFGEVTVRRALGRQTWVAGAAVEHARYHPLDVPRFEYSFTVPGVFLQDDVDVGRWLSISASGRLDSHSKYGMFASPRVSALVRAPGWSARVSAGSGFFAPTALTEETEAAGLSRLIIPRPLKAERARNVSVDLTRIAGSLSLTATVFASTVRDPVSVERTEGLVIENLQSPTRTTGAELLGAWRRPSFSMTMSYVYARAREDQGEGNVDVALTPRHSAGVDAIWQHARVGRVGVEWYYTGTQRLEANPYRDVSRSYVIFGVLVDRTIGRVRLFVNGENLTDARQTRWDPLVRPARGADGRWTVDAWAPLDGRNINGGLKISF